MNVFAIAAGMMAVIHLVAGWQRPRLAVIVSGILWLLYAVYERLVATGVLCDADCNIRVDLVFFIPILGIATFCAYQSYMGRQGHQTVVGAVLGAIGLVVFALLAERRAGTPVPTNEPTRALVTTGIHGWTRNPIYLGMFLVYGGIGIAVRSPSILILTLPLAIAIRYGVVAREEAYLERRFGDTYRDYKARVRRWV